MNVKALCESYYCTYIALNLIFFWSAYITECTWVYKLSHQIESANYSLWFWAPQLVVPKIVFR